MLVIAEWLNQYLDTALSVPELTEALEAAGVEVEGVQHPPELDSRMVVAAVTAVKPHPNADKLQLAVVDDGQQQHEVVCGAPNLYSGQRAAFAPVGVTLPNGTTIEAAHIRGVASDGMLCSEAELGLSQDHEGIIELDADCEPGTPLSNLYWREYTLIDITTAANRWDLQHYIGIAREVAAHTDAQLVVDKPQVRLQPAETVDWFDNQIPETVSGYGLLHITVDDKHPQTPTSIRRRLRLSGIKPINHVVDATNYAMLISGQPLHAFDADKVSGTISIRFAHHEETLETLDGVQRVLSPEDVVIADEDGPIALAGVIGGSRTEVDEDTREIVVEAATFSGVHVRKTAQRHGLRTEASARFERQLPLPTLTTGLQHLADLLSPDTDLPYQYERTQWPWVQHIGLHVEHFRRISGLTDVNREQLSQYLQRLQFTAEPFDISELARQQLGKPYKFGAHYKQDGTKAFDCSYLVDYLYSLIGKQVGHTAQQQYQNGYEIDLAELQPGDVLFRGGVWERLQEEERDGVAHVALYVGDDTIIEAREHVRGDDGEWRQLPPQEQAVVEAPSHDITEDPDFLGARRIDSDLESYVRITVPWWRPDVTRPEDIIEELVKLIGLDAVPTTLPPWHPTSVDTTQESLLHTVEQIRWLLYGAGLYEVITYPFISEADIELFRQTEGHYQLHNPRSREQAYLRSSLLPSLIRSVVNNATYEQQFALFECGRVFTPSGEQLPDEQLRLGIVARGEEVLALKRYLDDICAQAHLTPSVDTEAVYPWFHPARQAVLEVHGKQLVWFGVVHPDISQQLKHRSGDLVAAELDIGLLHEQWCEPQFRPLPPYPSSYRDLTVEVPVTVTWQDIERSLVNVADVIASFQDEYRKGDYKAVTIHVELLARERTLREGDIQQRMQRIQEVLERDFDIEVTL